MDLDLYLDIDGVILGRNEFGREAIILNIQEILEYCTGNYRCFWLTTQGRRRGDDVLQYLAPHCPPAVVPLLRRFEVAPWDALKTEAIDFSRPFIWIDDRPLRAEIQVLGDHQSLVGWLQVDTYRNLGDLTVAKIEAKRLEVQGMKPG